MNTDELLIERRIRHGICYGICQKWRTGKDSSSLMRNCRQLGIDPHAYLKDVLEKLPSATNHTVEELLPANWAQQSRVRSVIKA